MTLDEYFAGRDDARAIFDAVSSAIDALGPAEVRVTKSQVAFRRRRTVAVVWTPDRYLSPERSAPLVLTLSFPRRDPSPRWKGVTAVSPGRWTHHLELRSPGDIDAEVGAWLAEAWGAAG
jgi:hypothetical protein